VTLAKISVVLPTFNEEDNVTELCTRLANITADLNHDFEFIFIDNASTDHTVQRLEYLSMRDKRIKVIVNATNFGHIRSPFYGLLQSKGDLAILMASDLQDPPEKIPELIEKWKAGFKVVLLVKASTDEGKLFSTIRKTFYRLIGGLSETKLVRNSTGSGAFDREVVDQLRSLNDPYPYFRGLVVELGFQVATVNFHQPMRVNGKTKNNLSTLIDIGLLGLVTHSSGISRMITLFGFATAALGFLVGLAYLIAKLVFWNSFDLGQAPILIGIFLFGSVQIFLLGLVGEYLLSIQRRLRKMPLVIEDRRLNFD
jgi:polyisoprenyl-phosphate glycosyltransferase